MMVVVVMVVVVVVVKVKVGSEYGPASFISS